METERTEDQSLLRRIGRNFGKLLRGRGVAAVLELTTVAVLARSLSPENFGQLVLVQTYVQMVRGLFNFRLHETVVRFGVPVHDANNLHSLRRLLRLTLFIDIAASGASIVVAILAVPLAGLLFDWDQDLIFGALIYSSILLTSAKDTPKGILRLFDRFDALGIQLMISPFLRLLGVLIVSMQVPDVLSFVVVLALGTLAGNIYLIVRGWMEYGRQVGGSLLRGPSIKGWRDEFPDLRGFLSVVYLQSNLDNVQKQAPTLLAGALLGAAGAGMLRIAREATKILSKPGALLQQVLFPNLVRMWTRHTANFHSILLRIVLVSGVFGLVFISASIFGGRLLLTSILGPDYAEAAPLMSLLLFAATLELMVFMLRTGGYAMGLAGKILWLYAISAVLYVIAFIAITPSIGLLGPGFAACFSAAVTLVGISFLVSRGIRDAQLDPGQSRE
ncbi:MAG: lipopolysaccharide biosynthesis protein [Gammaproteobacteria bacterium]|nr:lipopolysaccharide biosynthesis protein [Gammaproteobacteria bacterium]